MEDNIRLWTFTKSRVKPECNAYLDARTFILGINNASTDPRGEEDWYWDEEWSEWRGKFESEWWWTRYGICDDADDDAEEMEGKGTELLCSTSTNCNGGIMEVELLVVFALLLLLWMEEWICWENMESLDETVEEIGENDPRDESAEDWLGFNMITSCNKINIINKRINNLIKLFIMNKGKIIYILLWKKWRMELKELRENH